MKIGIVGYGNVGKAMKKLFNNSLIYDISHIEKNVNYVSKNEINKCDAVFICVPTPMNNDGSCDTSIVEEIISWCESNLIIIRSTVSIGFTDEMVKKYNKKIVFQPEYFGETVSHPFANLSERNWLSFGGEQSSIDLAIAIYQSVVNSNVKIFMAPAKEVEMAKYMENSFFAVKVSFCNEIFDICKKMNINYNQAREIWLADPRIGYSHTFVYEDNRGFGGSCLPKDISSLKYQFDINNVNCEIITATILKNKKYKK